MICALVHYLTKRLIRVFISTFQSICIVSYINLYDLNYFNSLLEKKEKGNNVRPPGKVENPVTLTKIDKNHPYYMSMYDLSDTG